MNLRVVRKSAQQQVLPDGGIAQIAPEVVYEFQEGWLSVVPGRDVIADGPWDDKIGGPSEQDALSYLRNHPDFGHRFLEILPAAPEPSDVLVDIGTALATGDVEKLTEIGNEEAATWKRQVVLDKVNDALDQLETATAS
jgi:hypothetical protein